MPDRLATIFCDKQQLKLGDFGITRHQSDTRGIAVGTRRSSTAASASAASATRPPMKLIAADGYGLFASDSQFRLKLLVIAKVRKR